MVRRTLILPAAAATAAFAWGSLIERRWYVLRHATLPVLDATATGALRVLHVSDLHQLARQRHRLEFLRECGHTAPDVVVATGDLLEEDAAIAPVVEALTELARGRVAVAVLGSHDYWSSPRKDPLVYLRDPSHRAFGHRLDTDRLVRGLSEAGYALVDNRRTCIDTPAGPIDVTGLGDAHVDFDHPERIDWSPPQGPVILRIGVAHAPYRRVLDRFDAADFDLVLAGHTHGGQVRVPLFGALTNNTDLPLRQSRGVSRYGADLWLHVSAGLGHSRYAPFRFAGRPEATVLDLVPRL